MKDFRTFGCMYSIVSEDNIHSFVEERHLMTFEESQAKAYSGNMKGCYWVKTSYPYGDEIRVEKKNQWSEDEIYTSRVYYIKDILAKI